MPKILINTNWRTTKNQNKTKIEISNTKNISRSNKKAKDKKTHLRDKLRKIVGV